MSFLLSKQRSSPKPSQICPSIVTIAEKPNSFMLGKVTQARDSKTLQNRAGKSHTRERQRSQTALRGWKSWPPKELW
ncbi:hypothetical protein POPTR_001G225804v4 [Populus trichocarpa]|uniref:Uncharacterized protein n=1 Tax=Populus trichocarpa TaxID=3694 RepID=A0ACC0TKP3_POPTR|nr:hypothetical protein BDE02_01G201300 [Populus trichocarpa]KAI9402155.1 hypothetical protein POPTR_001G225804v4 [Populus trichocarpa]